MRHNRAVGHCGGPNFLAWFARHGLSLRDMRRDGVDTATLRATGDAMAIAVAEEAEREAANGR